jgi:hypothetical protein
MREQKMRNQAEMEGRGKSALPQPGYGWNHLGISRTSTPVKSLPHLPVASQPGTRSANSSPGLHARRTPGPGYLTRDSAPGMLDRHARPRTDAEQLRRFTRSQGSVPNVPDPSAPHRLAPRRAAQHAAWNSLSQQLQQEGAAVRRDNDWTTWTELSIKVYGLTPNVSTLDLWKSFNGEGSITTIKLFEDSRGNRDGKARIGFRFASAKDVPVL